MLIGDKEVQEIIVQTCNGELIASIADSDVIEKEGYEVDYVPIVD